MTLLRRAVQNYGWYNESTIWCKLFIDILDQIYANLDQNKKVLSSAAIMKRRDRIYGKTKLQLGILY